MRTKMTESQRICKRSMSKLHRLWSDMQGLILNLYALEENKVAAEVREAQVSLRKSAEADYTYHFDHDLPEWKTWE